MSGDGFAIELRQQADYRFEAHFDNPAVPVLVTDENPPLGQDAGPNPARLLAVAVANCLSASLLFALRKFKNEPGPLRTVARVGVGRNAQNRTRIQRIEVDIHLGVPGASLHMGERALGQFEDFCTVTASVRGAIDVVAQVFDSTGVRLHTSEVAAA